ncbi:MAG: class I SAM-dependent methyltransferase [Anaerolineae bacterium]|nr:class I SAM-dependent methyltransferase [Anaerolineae bacterium]
MSETQILSGVPETLLIPLYYRAMETQRPDAMIKDEKAVELIKRLSSDGSIRYDFDWLEQTPMAEMNKVLRIMLTREMDRYTRDFLARHPEAVVVHIGCGLDSRFERVDNGQVTWYDLDLPEVIDLRRKLMGDETVFARRRYHLLGCSVLESAWLKEVSAHSMRLYRGCPFLFLVEGVFMYFEEVQVKMLVLTLRDYFPGAELVFDAWRPFEIWMGNLVLGGLLRWGLWRGQELERWGDGIRQLDEWGYFDRPEPRLHSFRWMAPIFRLLKPMRVFHFQLGEAVE